MNNNKMTHSEVLEVVKKYVISKKPYDVIDASDIVNNTDVKNHVTASKAISEIIMLNLLSDYVTVRKNSGRYILVRKINGVE